MELEIVAENLCDFPYTEANDKLFRFDDEIIQDLSDELSYGNPSCYLVSGYRGVGKSSFIKKLECTVKSKSTADRKVFFVTTSFAKYQNQSFLIRKLLRELYLQAKDSKEIEEVLRSDQAKETREVLETLYKRTFYEVRKSESSERTKEKYFEIGLNFEFLKECLNVAFPAFLILVQWFESFFSSHIVLIISIIWLMLSASNLVARFVSRSREDSKLFIETLYDEEIAGHHFSDVLKRLLKLKCKVIFVLDELDKVEDEEVRSLINEMKPYLVSGISSFIVVSGQRLFYRYYQDQSRDDSVLSSLFSRIIHIPLASPTMLRDIFYNNILRFAPSEQDKDQIDQILSFFIFSSRLVHRRFVSIIRQHTVWRNGKLFVTDGQIQFSPHYAKMVDVISGIRSSVIEGERLSRGIKDYAIMTLYLECEQILSQELRSKLI